MDNLVFGRRITEEVFQNGNIVNHVVHTEPSIPLDNLQELWDNIIEQVARLKNEDILTFTISCDHDTRQPNRMVVVGKRLLK